MNVCGKAKRDVVSVLPHRADDMARLAVLLADGEPIVTVIGKFNAGKSSLCNLLADRFAAHGKTVEYFYLDAGRIVETRERFKASSKPMSGRAR
ncbi:hypothetical protein [Caballeronia sp. INDeC2]|uniref:hypothetical protein n=1 Tax=Caballeronia sp. INDeC2 TaxID=2921747 RepID=UPI0032EB9C02